ncbi:MAG: hypothetical protein O3C20_10820, partial [Verrucomicrobia bacterium]|nr:hypothetical protein [Verrucomicrobiota bacterium]
EVARCRFRMLKLPISHRPRGRDHGKLQVKERFMEVSIEYGKPTKSEDTKTHPCRLKPTCARSCVPARNLLGHVVIYAPALACELRLPPSPKGVTRAPHHIG